MPRFLSELTASWVANRPRLLFWYAARRFSLPFAERFAVTLRIAPRFTCERYKVRVDNQGLALQLLGLFTGANSWNQLSLENPAVIVDLGANQGLSTLYWRSRYAGAAVHGVEMDAANIARCRTLFAENKLEGTFHHIAIAGSEGRLQYRPHASHARNRLAALCEVAEGDYAAELVSVDAQDFASFLRRNGIEQVDLLKVDIEGAEQFLLDTVEQWAQSVNVMLLEIHHNIDAKAARAALEGAGFEVAPSGEQERTEWWCFRKPRAAIPS